VASIENRLTTLEQRLTEDKVRPCVIFSGEDFELAKEGWEGVNGPIPKDSHVIFFEILKPHCRETA